jgi:hypothetical protein
MLFWKEDTILGGFATLPGSQETTHAHPRPILAALATVIDSTRAEISSTANPSEHADQQATMWPLTWSWVTRQKPDSGIFA